MAYRGAATALAMLVASVSSGPLALAQTQPTCDMKPAFNQKDLDAPGEKTAVWSDASGSALLFVEKLNINTDGTRRSYKVSDFWGEKDALNNLCNAMDDACADMTEPQQRERRILTQEAAAKGWPKDLLKATRISPSIIPLKDGRPCPEIGGFLVSATALHKPNVTDACDITNYVDALVTPALVIPKNPKGGQSEFFKRNAKVGDLVVAVRPEMLEPVFGVVGDTGPINKLGEASVAMSGKLLKKTVAPVNYQELRGKGEYKGKGWAVPRTAVLVFPGTRDAENPHMTVERIDPAAGERFKQWGGVPRLVACLKAMGYSKSLKQGVQ